MAYTPPLPSPESLREDEKAAYARVLERQAAYNYPEFVKKFPHRSVLQGMPGSRIQPYFAALLNSPPVAAGVSELGAVYRTRGEFPGGMTHADREWCDMVVCHELKWNWVLYVHALDAVAVGVRADAILALITGKTEALTPAEALRARFIRATVRGSMTEALFKELEAEIGVRACVEIAAFSGHLLMTVRLMQAFGMPDMPTEELIEFVEMIVDGRVAPPGAKERVPSPRSLS